MWNWKGKQNNNTRAMVEWYLHPLDVFRAAVPGGSRSWQSSMPSRWQQSAVLREWGEPLSSVVPLCSATLTSVLSVCSNAVALECVCAMLGSLERPVD